MMTQPGETDKYSLSKHIEVLNNHLGKKKIDAVIANNGYMDPILIQKYSVLEQKDPVIIDSDNIKDTEIILDDFVDMSDGTIKHNTLKLAFKIFSYLMM